MSKSFLLLSYLQSFNVQFSHNAFRFWIQIYYGIILDQPSETIQKRSWLLLKSFKPCAFAQQILIPSLSTLSLYIKLEILPSFLNNALPASNVIDSRLMLPSVLTEILSQTLSLEKYEQISIIVVQILRHKFS